jgi:hypothetical protein
MSVILSNIESLDRALKELGFKRRRFKPFGPRNWRKPGRIIYGNGPRSVVVVTGIELWPSWTAGGLKSGASRGKKYSTTVDDFFRDLLSDLIETGARNVILQGGGSVAIPHWFYEECQRLGIMVQVIDNESGPRFDDIRPDVSAKNESR